MCRSRGNIERLFAVTYSAAQLKNGTECSSMELISVPERPINAAVVKVTRHFKGSGGVSFQILCPGSTYGSGVWPVDLSKHPGRRRSPKDAQTFESFAPHFFIFHAARITN